MIANPSILLFVRANCSLPLRKSENTSLKAPTLSPNCTLYCLMRQSVSNRLGYIINLMPSPPLQGKHQPTLCIIIFGLVRMLRSGISASISIDNSKTRGKSKRGARHETSCDGGLNETDKKEFWIGYSTQQEGH